MRRFTVHDQQGDPRWHFKLFTLLAWTDWSDEAMDAIADLKPGESVVIDGFRIARD